MAIFRRRPPNAGVKRRWGRQKSRFSMNSRKRKTRFRSVSNCIYLNTSLSWFYVIEHSKRQSSLHQLSSRSPLSPRRIRYYRGCPTNPRTNSPPSLLPHVGRLGSGVRVSASFQKNPRRILFYSNRKKGGLRLRGVCPGLGWLPTNQGCVQSWADHCHTCALSMLYVHRGANKLYYRC